MIGAIGRLLRERRAATLVEFAIIAPVMMMALMGLGDVLYRAYVSAILVGAVQKAGRDSGIQYSDTTALDTAVQTMVKTIAPSATFASTRKNYDTFSQVAPEPFTDTNGNGVRDPGECFTDENGNGIWDADPGVNGQGGADDVVAYTMTVTYPRLFPVAILGMSATATASATTVLKNQPYSAQAVTTVATVCT